MASILFTGYLLSKHERSARRILSRLSESTGFDFSGATVERYWKDKSLHRFLSRQDLGDIQYRDAYFDIPAQLSPICGRWYMTVPLVGEGETWSFMGSAMQSPIPGVHSIDYEVTSGRREPEPTPSAH